MGETALGIEASILGARRQGRLRRGSCNANRRRTPCGGYFSLYFQEMPGTVKTTDYQCPVCEGRGRVPGRLPGRQHLCPECHGTGRVTPIRREQLLKRMK
jgi:DnaJ-class molecular chaperone